MSKRISISTIILFCILSINAQNFPLRLSRADDKDAGGNGGAQNTTCERRVKVSDERPSNCGLTYPYVLYPVIIEDFNYKEDLPNNWAFNFGYTGDDDYDSNDNGHIWMGTSMEAYANNLLVYNGRAHLLLKKEAVTQKVPRSGTTPRDYRFTGAALSSLFSTRQGNVEADIKFPENNLLWVAFWKRGKTQEIDIIEAWDDEPSSSSCDLYHQMKMHIHNNYGSEECVRGRKFNLAPDFYDQSHTYSCDFTDYRVDFTMDNILRGYANKYYEGPYNWAGGCFKDAESGIPNVSHGCNSMQNLKSCLIEFPGTPPKPNNWPSWLPWPYIAPYCILENRVDKDMAYPNTQDNMDVRISFAIRDVNNALHSNNPKVTKCEHDPKDCKEIEDMLFNNWNNFDAIDKVIVIDRVEVWHPIHCERVVNMNTLSDFLSNNVSGETGFASGSKINVSNLSNSGNFINVDGNINPPNYRHYPIHLLATEEVAFLGGNIEIHEGTYLRAEIINCSGQPAYNERQNNGGGSSENLYNDSISRKQEEYKIQSYYSANPNAKDSIRQVLNEFSNKSNLISATDNGSIIVYPNPTKDYLNIDMDEEDFNDLLYLELTNNLSQTVKYEKAKQLDLSGFASGLYQLKFIFSHGYIVVKSINKQ